jgi:hypothetical protein
MKDAILKHLGPKRTAMLKRRAGAGEVFEELLVLAEQAAVNREMTPAQKPIFAAINLQRRLGVRASAEDGAAFAAAGETMTAIAVVKSKA